ncbi:MAG: hypothetical protein SH856_14690 [Flavobacteriales bacterium]|nr:hypothetical protein [Flavobacteriales bacterium]
MNLAILFLLLTSFTSFKKTETTSFFVNGDCPMCEERIEAACDIKGSEFKAGIYFYCLLADGKLVDTKQMILTGN